MFLLALEWGKVGYSAKFDKTKYPNQRVFVVAVDGYAYLVPYVEDNREIFLKTIIPSRKATKQYLGDKT